MIVDIMVVVGLHFYDNALKKRRALEEQEAAHEDVVHETEKKASRAQKSATRAQKKENQKKMKQTNVQAKIAPTYSTYFEPNQTLANSVIVQLTLPVSLFGFESTA